MENEVVLSLVTAGLAVLSIVLGVGVKVLRSKLKAVADRGQKSFAFHGTIAAVVELIDDVITATHKTILSELKEKLADGNLTEQEVTEVVLSVRNEVMEIVNERVKHDLSFISDDVEKLVNLKVKVAITNFLKQKR